MMSTMTHARITEETSLSVTEALAAVEEELKARQFGVLWSLDINRTLQEKGQPAVAPFHILEVCSAPRAYKALTSNQSMGYFLPCKVVVMDNAATHKTEIGLLRPTLMAEMVDDPQHQRQLVELANEVESILVEAIHAAAQK